MCVCVLVGRGGYITVQNYHFDVFTRREKYTVQKLKEGGWGNVLTMLKVRVRLGGGVS